MGRLVLDRDRMICIWLIQSMLPEYAIPTLRFRRSDLLLNACSCTMYPLSMNPNPELSYT